MRAPISVVMGQFEDLVAIGLRELISEDSNVELAALHDCRNAFPRLTKLTSFFYLGGDGQEVMPDPSPMSTTPTQLPEPLEVGVARGTAPVQGATVRFEIVEDNGDGRLNGTQRSVDVPTRPDDVATCTWAIDNATQSQQVKATLLGPAGTAIHLPIFFSAERSAADHVRYFAPPNCTNLAGDDTVQDAIDRLAATRELVYVDGDGQEALPGAALGSALEVAVVSGCGPVAGANVEFKVTVGGGSVSPAAPATTDANGIATCAWTLDSTTPVQRVEARLLDTTTTATPPPVRFNATLSEASGVAYDPSKCDVLKEAGATTVQEAIDTLCSAVPTQRPSAHIVEVLYGAAVGSPPKQRDLRNDDEIPVREFLPPSDKKPFIPGIVIKLDRPIDPSTLEGKWTLAPTLPSGSCSRTRCGWRETRSSGRPRSRHATG
jgi:hypothetical protein